MQGVFYRATAKEVADKLELKGYVRNLPDESVEIICTGPLEKINKLIEWARQGPRSAVVEKVNIQQLELREFFSFEIKRG